jgi:uncharacterized protein YecT (DUF1311 family)
MRFRVCLLGACLFFSLCLPAAAQSEATAQAEVAFRQVDQELNAAYTALLGKAKARALKNDIREAQRAWLQFRDKEAALQAGVTSQGGSAYTMDYLANRTELTEARIKQLTALRSKL